MYSKRIRKVFITGGTSGIGYQASLKMIRQGHEIVLPCRNFSRVQFVLKALKRDSISTSLINKLVSFPIVDLSDLYSLECFLDKFIKETDYIDTLILNAGLQYTGSKAIRRSAQ